MALLVLLRRAAKNHDADRAIALAILQGRERARTLARERAAAELEVRAAARPVAVPGTREVARVADLAARTRKLATEAVEARARRVLEAKLRQIAATETVEAFEEERLRAAEEIALREDVIIVRRWDATMDRRTCAACDKLDGTEVPLGEPFDSGDPPLHPGCRCSVEYLVDEAGRQAA